LSRVTDEAESGHIRAPVYIELEHSLTCCTVQREHRIDGRVHVSVRRKSPLESCRYHTGSEALGEDERIAGDCAGVRLHALWIYRAGDGIAELDLLVGDAVAAENRASGLAHLFRAASQDFGQVFHLAFPGPSENRERGNGPSTHGIDIAQRIGRRDRAKR